MSSRTLSDPIDLHAVFNFRDLGGVRTVDGGVVQPGRVFRADGLHRLVPEDAPTLASLSLRTVVDLRTDGEVERWGHAPVEVTNAEVHHLSVIKNPWDADSFDEATEPAVFLADRYLDMLDEGPTALGTTLQLIADRGRHGLVFHCAAGKDRTGVVAALALGLVGVDDAAIAADYAATAPNMERLRAHYAANHPTEAREAMSQQPAAFMSCPPEAMLRFLTEVRSRWGSLDALATQRLGLSPDNLLALRRALVDD